MSLVGVYTTVNFNGTSTVGMSSGFILSLHRQNLSAHKKKYVEHLSYTLFPLFPFLICSSYTTLSFQPVIDRMAARTNKLLAAGAVPFFVSVPWMLHTLTTQSSGENRLDTSCCLPTLLCNLRGMLRLSEVHLISELQHSCS